MSRHTRPTTVVSQPPRLSISPVPVRLSRSHASWTDVVGLGEGAEHPIGHRLEVGAVFLELAGQKFAGVHGHILHQGSYAIDEPNPAKVTRILSARGHLLVSRFVIAADTVTRTACSGRTSDSEEGVRNDEQDRHTRHRRRRL
jgi:hypothetical protein